MIYLLVRAVEEEDGQVAEDATDADQAKEQATGPEYLRFVFTILFNPFTSILFTIYKITDCFCNL